MARFKCSSCGYRFAKQDGKATLCPYCGKASVVADSQNEAQKIVDEAVHRQYDF